MDVNVVIGCPGAGKTTYLSRVANRLDPNNTLILSYSRSAAKAIAAKAGPDYKASTIHALCYQGLGLDKSQVFGVHTFCKAANLEPPSPDDIYSPVTHPYEIYSWARTTGTDIHDAFWRYDVPYNFIEYSTFISLLQKYKDTYGQYEFFDMLDGFRPTSAPDNLLIDECYLPDVEVLTSKGFKLIKNVSTDDTVAQVDPDNLELSWTKPTRVIERHHCGKVVKFKGTHFYERCNLTVTENHKMLGGVLAKDVNFAKYPNGAHAVGDAALTDEERLAIAFQADGYKISNVYRFIFTKTRKIKRLIYLLDKLEIKWWYGKIYKRKNKNHKDNITIKFYTDLPLSKDLWELFDLQAVPCNKAREMLEEIALWDGYVPKKSQGSMTYYSTDKHQCEFVTCIATIAGYKALTLVKKTTNKKHSDCWRSQISKVQTEVHVKAHDETYNGKVYCVTVPKGYIVIRTEGNSPIVCGNCQDISTALLKPLKRLIRCGVKQLWLVGDPNQSIYTYAGADPELMYYFGGNETFLEQSYRCPAAVVRLAKGIFPDAKFLPTSEEGEVGLSNHLPSDFDVLLVRTNHLRRRAMRNLELPESKVITFHKAKGLQFDHVVLLNNRASQPADKLSEGRVIYTALTRAKKKVTIMGGKNEYETIC